MQAPTLSDLLQKSAGGAQPQLVQSKTAIQCSVVDLRIRAPSRHRPSAASQ